MKTNAILRIIAYSLAIVILSGALLTGIGIRLFGFEGSSLEISHGGQGMSSNVCTADSSGIRNIEIEWAAGSITIQPSADFTEIQIAESEVAEKYRMRCTQSGNTLSIRYGKNSNNFISFGMDTVSKDLVITVPAGWVCGTLEIDAASADVNISGMSIGELDFDGASGLCTLENCEVNDVDVEAASGDLRFSGSLNTLDFDGASADCILVLTNCPSRINLDGMSGKLDITLPSDCGFTVSTEGLSSDFSTDFQTTYRNGAHSYGDGRCRIEVNAMSGSVTIHDSGENCHAEHHSSHH